MCSLNLEKLVLLNMVARGVDITPNNQKKNDEEINK